MSQNVKMVSQVVFGRGSFNDLNGILSEKRIDADSHMLFLVDDVFLNHPLEKRIPNNKNDLLMWVNVEDEPTTAYVDELTEKAKAFSGRLPECVIGIGGGSTMDLAKAVSIMLTNPGSATQYQGWDLVNHPAVFHIGIPTLSGTGAEVSRTTVLIGPDKKLGINSDHSVFDQVLLDPDLTKGVPKDQYFYTGMDCYIHCVESLNGTYLLPFAQTYGEKSMDLCREVFLADGPEREEKLMMASFFGGISIAYSQVGICHALSYGLSFVLHIHHGIGNCIAFNQLEAYYPDGVREFREMMKKHGVTLPGHVVGSVSDEKIGQMVHVAAGLDPLWENALGPDWKHIMTPEKMGELYRAM